MSRYDATQNNENQRSSRIYKDLNLGFQKNTATKDIQKITDVEAVKRNRRLLWDFLVSYGKIGVKARIVA